MGLTELHMQYGLQFLNHAHVIQIGIEKDRSIETQSMLSQIIGNVTPDQIRETHSWLFNPEHQPTHSDNQSFEGHHREGTFSTNMSITSPVPERATPDLYPQAPGLTSRTSLQYPDPTQAIIEEDEQSSTSNDQTTVQTEKQQAITKLESREASQKAKPKESLTTRVKPEQPKEIKDTPTQKERGRATQRPQTTESTSDKSWADEVEEEIEMRKSSLIQKKKESEPFKTVKRAPPRSASNQNQLQLLSLLTSKPTSSTGQEPKQETGPVSSQPDPTSTSYVEKAKLNNATENVETKTTIEVKAQSSTKSQSHQKVGGDYPLRYFIKQAKNSNRTGTRVKALHTFIQNELSLKESLGATYKPFLSKEPSTMGQLAKTMFSLKQRAEKDPHSIRPLNAPMLINFIDQLCEEQLTKRTEEQFLLEVLENIIR